MSLKPKRGKRSGSTHEVVLLCCPDDTRIVLLDGKIIYYDDNYGGCYNEVNNAPVVATRLVSATGARFEKVDVPREMITPKDWTVDDVVKWFVKKQKAEWPTKQGEDGPIPVINNLHDLAAAMRLGVIPKSEHLILDSGRVYLSYKDSGDGIGKQVSDFRMNDAELLEKLLKIVHIRAEPA